MSINKKVLAGFLGLMMLAIGGVAIAAAPPAGGGGSTPAPTGTIINPGPILVESPCPDGWHLVPNSANGDAFACIPTKTPLMIECPTGMDYYDNGCEIGCQYVPK